MSSHVAMQQMGGHFLYRQISDEGTLVVDPGVNPDATTQHQLKSEIERYQVYFDMDMHFCKSVEGAAQEACLWVVRNADTTGLSEVDLQRFKNIAWNECVVKRFLTTQHSDVSTVGKSMLNIIRTLNLQWKGMEIMGLHPKIESAEKQVVMSCMEKRLIGFDLDVGRIARCLRRCPHFRDYFSNAVGCHIVAKTGHTPGLSKTQYSADLDYVYKNQGLFFFESALQRNRGMLVECIGDESPLGVDYLPRLCGLKLVSKGDVILQNPQDKPSVIVSTGDNSGGGGGGPELAAASVRIMSDSIDAFRSEMDQLRKTIDSRDITERMEILGSKLSSSEAVHSRTIQEIAQIGRTMATVVSTIAGFDLRAPAPRPVPPPAPPIVVPPPVVVPPLAILPAIPPLVGPPPAAPSGLFGIFSSLTGRGGPALAAPPAVPADASAAAAAAVAAAMATATVDAQAAAAAAATAAADATATLAAVQAASVALAAQAAAFAATQAADLTASAARRDAAAAAALAAQAAIDAAAATATAAIGTASVNVTAAAVAAAASARQATASATTADAAATAAATAAAGALAESTNATAAAAGAIATAAGIAAAGTLTRSLLDSATGTFAAGSLLPGGGAPSSSSDSDDGSDHAAGGSSVLAPGRLLAPDTALLSALHSAENDAAALTLASDTAAVAASSISAASAAANTALGAAVAAGAALTAHVMPNRASRTTPIYSTIVLPTAKTAIPQKRKADRDQYVMPTNPVDAGEVDAALQGMRHAFAK